MALAKLVLENGVVFEGTAFGHVGETTGEVVFNTSHTGYQEILTDPSYTGQMVVMTYPLMGNYGANEYDIESQKIWAKGLIVSEISEIYSNFAAEFSLDEYLKSQDVMGISGIDTRKLVRILRTEGAMRGIISATDIDTDRLVQRARAIPVMTGQDLASVVTTPESYSAEVEHAKYHVVAFDYGIKHNILRMLTSVGCTVTVVNAKTPAHRVLALQPDGIFLSNGPGDPDAVKYAIETIKELSETKVNGRIIPMFGICLGHQLLSLAFGAKTYKMKFGHHGSNHPVKNLVTGQIEITAQNHGFAVDPETMPKTLELTHLNLY
ncbi:MAG: glutamine-hydrolyzing carbamoyl-phosphate synthase small subunit, partial [Chlorobiales bacterium]|nr:glutamine-hydrolyzing carbamoyl-phosphate synthase small subunit [Chlorobiales bacterium]